MTIQVEQEPFENTLVAGNPVLEVSHVELWVGNALQAAHYFRSALGFRISGFIGPRTNCTDRMSYLMSQGNLRLILTSGLDQDSPISKWVHKHGDGVRDIAFLVPSVEGSWRDALRWGAESVEDPHTESYGTYQYNKCVVTAVGDTVHTLISAETGSSGLFDNFQAIEMPSDRNPIVSGLDHIAIAVDCGSMEHLANYYRDVFAMRTTHQEDINTAHSGMRSQVLQNTNGSVRLTIVEPVKGKRTSQIGEFIRFNAGPGVQHLALLTSDILATAANMKAAGVELLSPPAQYYDLVAERLPGAPFDIQSLLQLGVLLDRDEWGYLLQVFSKPVHCRPTLFVELIQRDGAKGFGRGNIRTLFEALELEQQVRGNL